VYHTLLGGVGDTYAGETHVPKVKICTPDSKGRGLRGDSSGKCIVAGSQLSRSIDLVLLRGVRILSILMLKGFGLGRMIRESWVRMDK
jgi:hypothetical protein